MRSILKNCTVVVALAALFAIVAACGGGGDTPAPPTAPEQPTTAAQQPTGGTASGAAEQPTQAPAMSDEPFRVGVMESLTGPGETYGNVALQAKQLAVDEINSAGGINGRMLELIAEDSKCSAQDAITAYNKLTDVDGVKIILGTSCSGAMLGAAPLAEADGVILFSGLATNPDIAHAGDYIFRTSMNDLQLGIDTGNVIWADGHRRLATITETTDYAEGVRRTTAEHFVSLGGEIVAEERYASDVTDFRSQLTKIINANPDAIHIAAQAEFSGGTVVKQVRELGYEGPLYSEIVPVGATALEVAGDAATGLKAVTAELDPANPKAQEVLENFRARYDYITLPWYLGSAYDDVYIAAECLKQTNDDQDADGFRDCMYGITWSGTIGDGYSFDADGEVVGLSNAVVEVLPLDERTENNQGYRILGQAGSPAAVSAAQPAPAAMSQEPFRIGAMDALTGPAETYGNPIIQAKQLAVEEINAAGGINGRMLELVPEDSKCAAQDAITAYNKLTDVDGVKIILGTTCSGAMLGAAPLAEAEGVIMLSASATSPDIATAGDYIFRTAINDNQLGIDTGNTLIADDIHHLATITESTDYAEGARRTTVARLEELDGHVVASESYTSDITDFRSQLTKLINADPDGIYIAAQTEFSAGTIMKQLRELGYEGPLYGETVMTGPESLQIAGEAATGMKAIIPNPELSTPAGVNFLNNFEARYGNVATIPWFQASAYDDVYIAAECLAQTGDDQDADGFRDCLNGLTRSGAIGDNYSFDEYGDLAGLSNVVVQILPLSERNDDNLGYVVLGQAPTP
ncbi:MAG: ABC transporter substrate-binding protein [Chloroflexota bacterium]|nr:ABC transporter substrate-binding protein [Chloroflexota bacterium]MDE2961461.1 ABC transporter substrate-binding protein [Chloroflexota bacterium]